MCTKRNETGKRKPKKIAVVTGASSGIGRAFVKELAARCPHLEEIWAIARKEQALEELQKETETKSLSVRVLPLDLTKRESRETLRQLLLEEKPRIRVLVNGAGAGFQKAFADTSLEELETMTELNSTALTLVTKICLPYLGENSRVFFFSSAAAFVPQPGFAVYAATKAYVLSLARALRRELSGQALVTVVCPGPVDTAFLEKMGGKEHMPSYKRFFLAKPEGVVRKALRDNARGKEISVPGISMKGFQLLCKCCPHSILMKCAQGAARPRRQEERTGAQRKQ